MSMIVWVVQYNPLWGWSTKQMRSSVSVHIAHSKYAEDTLKILCLSRESLEPHQGIGDIPEITGSVHIKRYCHNSDEGGLYPRHWKRLHSKYTQKRANVCYSNIWYHFPIKSFPITLVGFVCTSALYRTIKHEEQELFCWLHSNVLHELLPCRMLVPDV